MNAKKVPGRIFSGGRAAESPLSSAWRNFVDRLCIDWGFCVDVAPIEHVPLTRPMSADEVAVAVLIAEGMDPTNEAEWFRKIRNRFITDLGTPFSLRANDDEPTRYRRTGWWLPTTLAAGVPGPRIADSGGDRVHVIPE